MDVTFETDKGAIFTIELGYWDTILEIKERIQNYRDIPVAHQTLNFNGRDLDDDLNIEKSEILHKSLVRLIIAGATPTPEKSKSCAKNELLSPNRRSAIHHPPLPFPRRIQILLRMPSSSPQQLSFEVDLNDTVEQLKEKIHKIEGSKIPLNRMLLHIHGNKEMQDNLHVRNYNLTDGSEVDISLKPVRIVSPPQIVAGSRKLKVFLIPKCETMKLPIEVNPSDKVQVLRGELEKLQQRVAFDLPADGYFFIYKQNVMEDKESFQWHRVRQGDCIEIFNGRVTGGS